MKAILCLLAAGATVCGQVAAPETYLGAVIGELKKDWPGNRTVTVVCHGHSVPAGYFKTPVVASLEAYPHLLRVELARRFPHAVINVIVTAKGGEDSVSGAARFEGDVMALRPDVVLIDYSLNDRRAGLEAAEKAWRAMAGAAVGRGARVILLTPTPDVRARLGEADEPLERQAAQVRRLAGELGVGLVDSLELFKAARGKGRMEELMSQANHPNAAGHRLVAEGILKYFAAGE